MASSLKRRPDCRLCGSHDLDLVLKLEPTPPANAFLKRDALGRPEERFPLDVFFCRSCAHVQLLDIVDPEILFRDYVYVSGTSPVFVEHFRKYADEMMTKYMHTPEHLQDVNATKCNDGFVLEIGSNDGTLLRFFKERGFRVLGVDPAANLAAEANRAGIPTLPEFFSPKLAEQIVQKEGKTDLVVANNVFAHIDDLRSVVQGIRSLLHPSGVFVFEVSYLMDVYEKTLFDTIYHEHLSYHSVKPLETFFKSNGMTLIDVQRVSTHGGSLRGIAQLEGGPRPVSKSVGELIEKERAVGLHGAETFKKYGKKIDQLRSQLREQIQSLKKQGKKIAGFGAPAKATTLMLHFGIGSNLIDFIVDDSPLKQGLYSPGLHIPVVSSQAIVDRKPDYLVVLAWNFADSIIAKNQAFRDRGGRFIVPLPELKVI